MSSTKEIKAKRPSITFRVAYDLRNEFNAACDLYGVDMTSVLTAHMKKYVEEKRDNLSNIRSEYKGGISIS